MVPYPANGRGYRDLPPDAPSPRLCLIQKSLATDEYGFNLHAEKEKGQFIGTVDVGSPADFAGLKQGDLIFAVNGDSITGRSHKEVVSKIKSNPMKCEMLVISEEDYGWYQEHNIPIDMKLPNIIRVCEEFYSEAASVSSGNTDMKKTTVSIKSKESPVTKIYRTTIEVRSPAPSLDSGSFNSCSDSDRSSMRYAVIDNPEKHQSTGGKPVLGGGVKPPLMAPPARLSKLQKKSPTDEFGFNLHAERGKGHYIGSVDKNGIADRAGLVMGQRIVGVNNTLIYPNTPHNEVVGLIKRVPLSTELLVVSEEVDHWYAENGAEFSFDNAVRYNSQPIAAQSTTPSRNHQVESRIIMEKHPAQEEASDSNIIEYEEHQHVPLFEPNNSIQQTTTMSTIHTVTTSEVIPETPEDTDEIIDKIFKDVPLIPVGQIDSHNNSMDTLSRDDEFEHEPLITSESTNARVLPAARESPFKPPTNQIPLVIKPVTRTQSTDSKIPPSSPSSYASSPSPDPRGNGTTNGLDVFKLNAKEARQLLQKKKNDPRKQNLSLEQKHQMMDGPPEPILSDYIEMGTLVILFLIGGPLNLAAYTQITERPSYTRLDILKRHLNYSDLFVLFVYVPSRACWLLTYDWRGGDLLCRLVKCLHTLAFQISSNVIVCIALDRLLSVLSPSHHSPEKAHKRTRIMLWIAWVAAFIISAPQFAVWRSYLAFEKINWSQCMQIWEIIRAEASMNNNTDINYHALMLEENIYVIVHMLLIFWIPATIVVLCYLIVSCWVYFNSKPLAFNLENARNSTCGTAIMSSSRTRNGTRTTAVTGSAVITDNKHFATGVSYHTGVDTVETIISKSSGVRFATNPKIIINDDVMQPLTTRQSRGSTASFHMLPAAMPIISNNATYSAKLNRSYRSRAIRVSFLLVAAYIICWLPYNALSLIQFIDPETFRKHANKIYCLHGTIVLNSVINPFLYGLFGGKCRPKRRNR